MMNNSPVPVTWPYRQWHNFLEQMMSEFRRCEAFEEQVVRTPGFVSDGTQRRVSEPETDWKEYEIHISSVVTDGAKLVMQVEWEYGPPTSRDERCHKLVCRAQVTGWEGILDLVQLQRTMNQAFGLDPHQELQPKLAASRQLQEELTHWLQRGVCTVLVDGAMLETPLTPEHTHLLTETLQEVEASISNMQQQLKIMETEPLEPQPLGTQL